MDQLFESVGHASPAIGLAVLVLCGVLVVSVVVSEGANKRLSAVIRACRQRCGCKECAAHQRRRRRS